jgi:hypothetical protein
MDGNIVARVYRVMTGDLYDPPCMFEHRGELWEDNPCGTQISGPRPEHVRTEFWIFFPGCCSAESKILSGL